MEPGVRRGAGIAAIAGVAVFFFAWSCVNAETAGKPVKPAKPKTLPGLVLRDLDGKFVYLSHLAYPGEEQPRKPRSVMILNFFSVDCKPCIRELPLLLTLHKEYAAKGVKTFILAVDPLAKQDEVKEVAKTHKITCEVLRDPYQVACDKLGVVRIPQTFVVTKEGRIATRVVGLTDFEKKLRGALSKVLEGETTEGKNEGKNVRVAEHRAARDGSRGER